MIFVTVGIGQSYDFSRLIKKVDEISLKHEEDFILQIGPSNYIPQNTKWFHYADAIEIEKYIKNSRIVIAHGGVGTILTVLKYNKPLIVVPRSKMYNEHFDNHQQDLMLALKDKGLLYIVYDVNKLENYIKIQPKLNKSNSLNSNSLIDHLRQEINNLSKQK